MVKFDFGRCSKCGCKTVHEEVTLKERLVVCDKCGAIRAKIPYGD